MIESPKWIWYPGDFEIVLANKCMTRRYERDVFIPPFWKLDDCYHNVKFSKKYKLTKTNHLEIKSEGIINILLNGNYIYDFTGVLTLEPGNYEMIISCYNPEGLPSIYVSSEEIVSDLSWVVSCNDNQTYKVASSSLINNGSTPNNVKLNQVDITPTDPFLFKGKEVLDFGKELMAYLKIEGIEGNGFIDIYYGESKEEAVDFLHAETYDKILVNGEKQITTKVSKAFRYLVINTNISYKKITALYEYLPIEFFSSFKSSNPKLDLIYKTALHTLHLNTREFMLDGIKRDRWLWSGDAYQSYLMNYYSFFDKEVVKRTMIALFGKLPVTTHINHIMDYSFYWIMGFYDYYIYTGDLKFIEENFNKIIAMIDFCLQRCNENGLMEGLPGDWVFVDWADLNNEGEVCFEQMLLFYCLKIIVKFCELLNQNGEFCKYVNYLNSLEKKIEKFWDSDLDGYIYSYKDSEPDRIITKHANMFAILYGLCDEDRTEKIKKRVLLNPEIPKITTPYMRFYELSALCETDEYDYVYNEIHSYWGGMLDEGATAFWETFDKDEKGKEKYAMYGRRYGKSLCHAWGASPLFLLGKYFIGLRPTQPGYKNFELRPHLGGLDWFEAELPLNEGKINIFFSKDFIEVYCSKASGILILDGKFCVEGASLKYQDNKTIISIEKDTYYEFSLKPF